jgi:hypothetical protein
MSNTAEGYTVVNENIVHSNDNYCVLINDEGTGYGVMNTPTGVIEFEAISMPECIFAAENLNVVIVYKTYEWVGKRAERQKREDDLESAVSPVSSISRLEH